MTYHAPLTPRQQCILVLRLTGHSGDEIAAAMGITRHTVKIHLWNIKARLGLYTLRGTVRVGMGRRIDTGTHERNP